MDNQTQTENEGDDPPNGGRRTRIGNVDPDSPRYIVLTSNMTVRELAKEAACSETEIIKRLMMKGFMRTINQIVELVLARELAEEMGFIVLDDKQQIPPKQEEPPKPPQQERPRIRIHRHRKNES